MIYDSMELLVKMKENGDNEGKEKGKEGRETGKKERRYAERRRGEGRRVE